MGSNEVLVVGSVAYDTITTPSGGVQGTLGGSANFFSLSASMYTPVRVVGVVGDDYKESDLELLRKRGVDLTGLKITKGETFRWEGRYENDMNQAMTIATHLNVFKDFNPQLPESYCDSQYVFLANIDPELQVSVLTQIKHPVFVGADSMNYWISRKRGQLLDMLRRIDILLINEGECRELTGDWNTIQAVKKICEMGPDHVVIKRGEYGFVLYSLGQLFILPAFPVEVVRDPTGAGDSFAGGFFGWLARTGEKPTLNQLKQACLQGSLMASFTVEDFGLKRLLDLTSTEVDERFKKYIRVTSQPHYTNSM